MSKNGLTLKALFWKREEKRRPIFFWKGCFFFPFSSSKESPSLKLKLSSSSSAPLDSLGETSAMIGMEGGGIGTFDGTFTGTFDGTFDGTFTGTFTGTLGGLTGLEGGGGTLEVEIGTFGTVEGGRGIEDRENFRVSTILALIVLITDSIKVN